MVTKETRIVVRVRHKGGGSSYTACNDVFTDGEYNLILEADNKQVACYMAAEWVGYEVQRLP